MTTKVPNPTFCETAHQICIGPGDTLTDATARMILDHNRVGVKLCKWKPVDCKRER